MAEETIDRAIVEYGLKPQGPCNTEKLQLLGESPSPHSPAVNESIANIDIHNPGSHGWSKMMYVSLIQHFGLEVISLPPLLSWKFSHLRHQLLTDRVTSPSICQTPTEIERGKFVRWPMRLDFDGLFTEHDLILLMPTSRLRSSSPVDESTLRRLWI